MIGLFLCWAAGSYWKKIYYVYITLQEILLLLGFGIASTRGEEGDYDSVTGGEMSVIVIALVPAFVYCSDCYSAVLPSSYFAVFSSMFWGFCIKGTDFLTVKGWKGGLLLWGIGIILTAAGCLIQLLILKKTEMGTKKRNKLSEALK